MNAEPSRAGIRVRELRVGELRCARENFPEWTQYPCCQVKIKLDNSDGSLIGKSCNFGGVAELEAI